MLKEAMEVATECGLHIVRSTAANSRGRALASAGRAEEALDALRLAHLLALQVRGPDHPDTLATRYNLALLTGQAGDTSEARQHFTTLLADQTRVLGPEHPNTLATARWLTEAGSE